MSPAGSRNNRRRPVRSFLSTALEFFPGGPPSRRKGRLYSLSANGSCAEPGRFALWNGEIADCVDQNHIIKARPQADRLLPEFAMAWFNSWSRSRFKSGKKTGGQATINSTVIRTAPLPTIEVQIDWVARLATIHAAAQTKRTHATSLRNSAWVAFESALFTPSEPGSA